MKYQTYRWWKALVVIILAALVGWSVPAGYAWVPVPAAVVAVALLLIVRRGVREVVVDERTYNIANRAARMAFQVGVLAMALLGATLLALGYGDYPNLEPVGLTLVYTAAGLLVIYLIGYYSYSRKLGGQE